MERGGNVKHGCHAGCVIQCSRYYVDKDGHYMTKGPEYESAWSLGADCGISDMDTVAALDRKCGDIGIDTIEAGVHDRRLHGIGQDRVRRWCRWR